ncbi:MAG: hypothetical protein EOP84_13705 [Verrucomicrobiaceae bacterium]|nr:MAG: hypothetical protein EOP84_13705 [Verrucomicrobiaceae bacterium]
MIETSRHWENGNLYRFRVAVPELINVKDMHERIIWADQYWHHPSRPGYTIHREESRTHAWRGRPQSEGVTYFYFRRYPDAMSYLLRWGGLT